MNETLLVLLTAVYATITFFILKETRHSVKVMERQILLTSRPYVTVTLATTSQDIVYLVIINNGRSAAENLKLSVSPDFNQLVDNDQYSLAQNYAFREGLMTFPPGSELRFAVAHLASVPRDKSDSMRPAVFTIGATYTGGTTIYTETTIVDLRPYVKTFPFRDTIQYHLAHITSELSAIREALAKLT